MSRVTHLLDDENRPPWRSGPQAATLLELLVVVAIIGLLATLLLPALQAGRDSGRSAACRNNLRQIGLALLNYEAVHGHFPMGAEGRYDRMLAPTLMFGLSWWADTLPYLEETEVAERLDRKGAHSGWVGLNPHNGALVQQFAPAFWYCPSTPLDRFTTAAGFRVAAPSYVGISGATSDDSFPETRVSAACCNGGEISAGGVLVPNTVIRVRQISDGLSNTLLAGEQSDFAYAKYGVRKRIDGSFANGWISGTNALGVPPNYGSSFSPSYNLATLRYHLNERRYELPGIYEDRGANNPLLSPHAGIVNLLYCDGSVQGVDDSLDVWVLKSIATRDESILITP